MPKSGIAGALIAAVLATLFVAVPGSVANADPATGSIVVTATNYWNSLPSSGGCIDAIRPDNSVAATVCTGASGVYSIPDLAPGEYKISARNFTGAATTQYSGQSSTLADALALTVSAGAATPYALTLYSPYSVVGRVVDGGGNLAGAGSIYFTRNDFNNTYSTSDGNYVTVVPECASTCHMRAQGFAGHAPSWYLLAAQTNSSGVVTLRTSVSSVYFAQDLVLSAAPASITGTITAPDYFTSSEVCVVLYGPSVTPGDQQVEGVECGQRGEPFSFQNLAAGRYGICVVDQPSAPTGCSADTRYDAYKSGPPSSSEVAPDVFQVAAGQDLPINFSFGGNLNVTVKASPNVAIDVDVCVDLYSSTNALVDTQCGRTASVFHMTMPEDSYGYSVFVRGAQGYADRWSPVSPTTWFSVYPGPITFVDGATVNLQVPLQEDGRVAGSATLQGGATSEPVCVRAFDLYGVYSDGPRAAEACTNPATGMYSLDLPPGDYRLQFYTHSEAFAFGWYTGPPASPGVANGTPTRHDALVVHVNSGATTTVNTVVAGAARVTGTVASSSGIAPTDGCVFVYEDDGDYVYARCLEGGSTFALDSLLPGTYVLYFASSSTHESTWIGGTSFEDAARVTLLSGQTKVRNVTVSRLGTVVGQVRDESGRVAVDGCVAAFEGPDLVAEACDQDGSGYALSTPAGTYTLLYSGWEDADGNLLADLWHEAVAAQSDADPIVVQAGQNTVANQVLEEASGVLSVHVGARVQYANGSDPVPATGGCVTAFVSPDEIAGRACAGDDGIAVLRITGTARLWLSGYSAWFAGGTYPVADQWEGATNEWAESPEYVVAPNTSSSVNAVTSMSGELRLSLQLDTGGYPTGGTAELYAAESGQWVATAPIEGDGTVYFDNLMPFEAMEVWLHDMPGLPDQSHASFYSYPFHYDYEATYAPASALPVTVATGTPVSGRLLQPYFFEGQDVCVRLWRVEYSETLDDAHFVDERCGLAGDEFTFEYVFRNWNSSTQYYFDFTDGRGNYAWYSEVLGWGQPSVVIVAGEPVRLTDDFVDLLGPSDYIPGQTVKISVDVFSDGSGNANLWYTDDGVYWYQSSLVVPVVNGSGSLSFTPINDRFYAVVFGDMASNSIRIEPYTPTVTRIGGESRYDVAVGISQQYFAANVDTVYIAAGGNFPDALGAAPAAALRDAPLLLVPTDSIPASVVAELLRLNPDKIIVTGGPASVSDNVLMQLQDYARIVSRINGPDRYEVSRSVTREAFMPEGSDIAYIATGATFPDALSASAAAGSLNAPVILLYGAASTLDAATRQLLIDLEVKEIRIAGGPASVSPGIETGLRGVPGVTTVTRLTGEDRFIVSGATNRAAFDTAETVFIASGYTFPDALAGAPVAGALGAPLYVIPSSCIPNYVLEDIVNLGATEVRILGGPGSVTPEAAALRRC